MRNILRSLLLLSLAVAFNPVNAQQAFNTTLTWSCVSSSSANNNVYTCTAAGGQFQVQWPASANLTPSAANGVIALTAGTNASFSCTAAFNSPTAPTQVQATCTGSVPSSLTYSWTNTAGSASPSSQTTTTDTLPITPAATQPTYLKYSVTACDVGNSASCASATAVAQNTISPPSGCTITSTAGSSGLTVTAGTPVPLAITGCQNVSSDNNNPATTTWTPAAITGASGTVTPSASTNYTATICNPTNKCVTTATFTVNVSANNTGVYALCGSGFDTARSIAWPTPSGGDNVYTVQVSASSGAVFSVDIPSNGDALNWSYPSIGAPGALELAFSRTQACAFGTSNTSVGYTNSLSSGGSLTNIVYSSAPSAPFTGIAKLSPGRWYITVRGKGTTAGSATFQVFPQVF